MIEPPFTWAVSGGKLRLWRGKQFLGAIPRDLFPALIVTMAAELRDPAPRLDDDPDVPLG
jgi:hypothetical protein